SRPHTSQEPPRAAPRRTAAAVPQSAAPESHRAARGARGARWLSREPCRGSGPPWSSCRSGSPNAVPPRIAIGRIDNYGGTVAPTKRGRESPATALPLPLRRQGDLLHLAEAGQGAGQ